MINQFFELHTILFTALNDIDEIIFQEEDSVYTEKGSQELFKVSCLLQLLNVKRETTINTLRVRNLTI